MKALLLSAGLGIRLRPITDKIPKVMVPINGKPCLQYHIENLKEQGITEFAINTHYMPDAIKNYFGDGSKFGVKIIYSDEPEPLGTSGALNNFKDFFDETFIVVYGDVLANFKIDEALKVHMENNALATILLDSKRDIKGKGLVRFEGDRVLEFVERPEHNIEGSLINSGFYILEPEIFNHIPEGFSDFGRDILPKLASGGKVCCEQHEGHIFDIGTFADLDKAQEFLKNA